MEKNREKNGISYNKHGKKVNAWAGFCKYEKTCIQLFTENKLKSIYVNIMEKHLKEIEAIAGNSLELLWNNYPKHTSNLAKEYY